MNFNITSGTATAQREVSSGSLRSTMKPMRYTKYNNLPPVPRPTPSAIRIVQGDCKPQPAGYGPVPKYDNMRGFYYSPEIHAAAANAAIPPDYIQSFAFANGSFVGKIYLGHFELQSYDTLACSKRCDEWGQLAYSISYGPGEQADSKAPHRIGAEISETADGRNIEQPYDQACQGFNVYFERSPAIQLGPKCRESTSRTIIKCALWGEPLRIEGATNIGYREWDFDVVIAGSNGYNLEKYAETDSMASGKKTSKAVVAALFVGQLLLGLMLF